jgi:coenzyme F420-reducing hydrogenase alpha subunit
VNLIVATGHNSLAMNRTVAQIARHYVQGEDIPSPSSTESSTGSGATTRA